MLIPCCVKSCNPHTLHFVCLDISAILYIQQFLCIILCLSRPYYFCLFFCIFPHAIPHSYLFIHLIFFNFI